MIVFAIIMASLGFIALVVFVWFSVLVIMQANDDTNNSWTWNNNVRVFDNRGYDNDAPPPFNSIYHRAWVITINKKNKNRLELNKQKFFKKEVAPEADNVYAGRKPKRKARA